MGLAACGSGEDGTRPTAGEPASPQPGGAYVAEIAEPTYLAPATNCYESECFKVLNMINDPLVTTGAEDGELVFDGLADSVEPDADQTVWTVTLKPGRTFHNGEPVTSRSFANGWNYSQDPENGQATAGFMSRIEGAGEGPEMSGFEVVDDLTFRVRLTGPFSQFGQQLSAMPAFAPIADACLADVKACNEEPIGTGPYLMDGPWQHDEAITVTRWSDYTGDQPAMADSVTFRMFATPAAAYREFQNGGLDVMRLVPEVYVEAKQALGEEILEVPTGELTFLGLPTDRAPYDDPAVRQALSLSIDRELIIDKVLNGLAYPATDLVPPPMAGSRDGACEYCTHDPERARSVLADAGVDLAGETVPFSFVADAGHDGWIEAAARQVQEGLGVDYRLESARFAQYIGQLSSGKIPGPYYLSWLKDYPSPENFLRPLVSSEGDANFLAYANPDVDALLEEGDRAATAEQGIERYQQAGDLALADMPMIPLWTGKAAIVASDRVTDVDYDTVDSEINYKEVAVRR